jgi:hypothetical protein
MKPEIEDLNDLIAHLDSIEKINHLRLLMIEEQLKDHEQRIRCVNDGVTQFKVFFGLTSGGSSILSIIALIKAFFGL